MNIEKAQEQLGEYGYSLTDTFQISKGDKIFPVVVSAKGPRFYVKQMSGAPLWSGPDLGDFVKSFWYAKKIPRHESNASDRITPEDAARWIALQSDDYDAFGGSEGYGWGRATTDDVAAALGVSTEEAYRLLKAAARKDLVTQDKERRKGVQTKRYGASQVGWAIWEAHLTREQALQRHGAEEFQRLYEQTPNGRSHYVWALRVGSSTPLSTEGPYGPMSPQEASQYARISATEGIHDRAVSVGKDPEASGFRIVRRYAAGTGERLI